MDPVVVERAVGRALLGRDVVLVSLILVGHMRPILMREYVDHTGNAYCGAGVDARDPPLRDGGVDDITMDEAGNVELAGILGFTGNLCPSIDAGCRRSDIACHGAHRTFLSEIDCGVP